MNTGNVVFVVLVSVAVAVAAENHDDRWFNGFYGPNVYFGSNSRLGQLDDSGHRHPAKTNPFGRHHHRHGANLEACECVDVIGPEQETSTASTTAAETAPTSTAPTMAAVTGSTASSTTTTESFLWPVRRVLEPNEVPGDNQVPELANAKEDRFYQAEFRSQHQRRVHRHRNGGGGHLDDDVDVDSSGSGSDEKSQEIVGRPHRVPAASSEESVGGPKEDAFVDPVNYVENSNADFVHYRRRSGFRNPFTGRCVCSRNYY